MSEAPRRILHLVIEGFPADQIPVTPPESTADTEVLPLTSENAREALAKIFAADSVAVWAPL